MDGFEVNPQRWSHALSLSFRFSSVVKPYYAIASSINGEVHRAERIRIVS